MKIHYLKVRAFAGPESLEPTRELISAILPEGAQIEEKTIEPELEGGVFTNTLHDVSAKLSGGQAQAFLRKMLLSLDEYDFASLKEKKDLWTDDECNLYLRLSRREAAEGRMVFDSKDPLHLTVKIAAYPAKKDNAIKAINEMITEAENDRKTR